MRVTVLFFAAIRDHVGMPQYEVDAPASVKRLGDLVEILVQELPALQGKLEGVRYAVNEQFADIADELHSGDVVAVIPPVSGG